MNTPMTPDEECAFYARLENQEPQGSPHSHLDMTLRLPPEIEEQLWQVAEAEHLSVQQTVLVAIEQYISMRETARNPR